MSNPVPEHLPQFQSEDFLPPVSRWLTLGGWLLVGTLGGAIALASTVQYSTKVSVKGTVGAIDTTHIVRTPATGQVSRVDVQEQQVVATGDPIVSLRVAPESLSSQSSNFESIPGHQLQSEIAALEVERDIVQSQLIEIDQSIFSLGQIEQFAGAYASQTAEYLEQIEAALAKVAVTQLALAETLDQQRRTAAQTLVNLDQQIESLRDQMEAMQPAQISIQAPVDGTVVQLSLPLPGETVQVDTNIAQILSTDGELVVKAWVSPQDIATVDLGQIVQMRISAYPYPDYGILSGEVMQIAATTSACDESCVPGINQAYEIKIQPQALYLTKGGQQYDIRSGMEVTADIVSDQERFITFLLRKARLLTGL